jgi:hypothetical protein
VQQRTRGTEQELGVRLRGSIRADQLAVWRERQLYTAPSRFVALGNSCGYPAGAPDQRVLGHISTVPLIGLIL